MVKTLLHGAEETTPKDVFRRSYVKHGGIRQMVRDFNNFIFEEEVKRVSTKDGVCPSGKHVRVIYTPLNPIFI